jgi:hypothetical protein
MILIRISPGADSSLHSGAPVEPSGAGQSVQAKPILLLLKVLPICSLLRARMAGEALEWLNSKMVRVVVVLTSAHAVLDSRIPKASNAKRK